MIDDIIIIEIRCSFDECEQIRNSGQFFEAIADALCVARNDIKEIIKFNK